MTATVVDTVWDEAVCRQPSTRPDWWFFDSGDRAGYERAVALCAACPLTEACQGWAVTSGASYGVWGGLTADQITDLAAGRPMRRQRPWVLRTHGISCPSRGCPCEEGRDAYRTWRAARKATRGVDLLNAVEEVAS